MGWSDVSLSVSGPVTQDMRTHFAQRWNFIYGEKYSKKDTRYAMLSATSGAQRPPDQAREGYGERGYGGSNDYEREGERGLGGGYDGEEGERGLFGRGGGGGFRDKLLSKVNEGFQQVDEMTQQHGHGHHQQSHAEHSSQRGGVDLQMTRSISKWSHNMSTEVSHNGVIGGLISNHTSARFKTHTAKSSGTASISSTLRTSSSLQLLGEF